MEDIEIERKSINLIKRIISLINYDINRWIKHILFKIPGRFGCIARNLFIPYRNHSSVRLWEDGFIEYPRGLSIEKNSAINRGYFINARGLVEIGQNVLIGPNVLIYTTNHIFDDVTTPITSQGQTKEPVVIKDDVWIGAMCVILPGVTIKEGSVVGAGSVVTKDIEPYTVVAGVPAVKIRSRKAAN